MTETNIRFECLRPASDGWESPTGEEVRELLRIIAAKHDIQQFTGGMAARFLGLGAQGDRTLRRWTSGNGQTSSIPYAAWALLCDEAGFESIWRKKPASKRLAEKAVASAIKRD